MTTKIAKQSATSENHGDREAERMYLQSGHTSGASRSRSVAASVIAPVDARFEVRAHLYAVPMCRNITELRGLEPPATRDEIEAAARQFVRKISGVTKPKGDVAAALEDAALKIAHISERLLADLPARRQPPKTDPPLRRPEVRKRLGLPEFNAQLA